MPSGNQPDSLVSTALSAQHRTFRATRRPVRKNSSVSPLYFPFFTRILYIMVSDVPEERRAGPDEIASMNSIERCTVRKATLLGGMFAVAVLALGTGTA